MFIIQAPVTIAILFVLLQYKSAYSFKEKIYYRILVEQIVHIFLCLLPMSWYGKKLASAVVLAF